MRVSHELERGVICERCLNITTKEMGYKRIQISTPIKEDSTGRIKHIDRMNLCNECYEEYKSLIREWTKQCKNCEYCDLAENKCLVDNTKCYEKGKPLHSICNNYKEGSWCPM